MQEARETRPNVFAVDLYDDIMWMRGSRYFSPHIRLFTTREEAEKYREGTTLTVFEYHIASIELVRELYPEILAESFGRP